MPSSQPHIQSTSPMDANGVVRCVHGETAMIRTSQTSSNPGREFYTCSRSIQSERCKFFYWVDDPIFSQQQQHIPIPHSVAATAPSRSSPSQRGESTRAMSTPQKSPRKRIAEIAAALNELGPQAPSTPQHHIRQQSATATDDHKRSFLFGSPSSQASTIGEREEPSPQDNLGQGGSSSSANQSLGNLEPSTPKKRRIEPVEQRSSVHIPFPLTPPQTEHRANSHDQGIFQADFPQTPTRNKGKERENSGGEQMTSGANARVPGPFENGSIIERAFDVPARTSNTLERTSSNPFIVDQTTGESIASHLEALDALKSPSYIRKMEKKLNALDQSNKFKAKYLEDLKVAKAEAESENARLTAENTGLQSENARLAQANAHLQERLLRYEHSSRVKDI